MTILEAITLTSEYLERKGIESPRLNAELMLSGILKCKRMDLYLSFDKPLADPEIQKYREYLRRRANFEPLQYILGEVEFYGLNFRVDSSVLIPRPETELLVDEIVREFRGREVTILDIGTGSGNIPIALAKFIPASRVYSIDVSQEALDTARCNAEINQVAERIDFIKMDIFQIDSFPAELDIIVSNPPYVSNEEYQTLQKEITGFEPAGAVTDFSNGLTFYEEISKKAQSFLRASGRLYFEIGKGQHPAITEMMRSSGFENIKTIKDLSQIERIIYGEKN